MSADEHELSELLDINPDSKITWQDAIIGYYTARNYAGGDKDKIKYKAANELAKLVARRAIVTDTQYVGETEDEFLDRVIARMERKREMEDDERS